MTVALPVSEARVQFVPFEVHLVTRGREPARPALFSGCSGTSPTSHGAAVASGSLLPFPPDASREGPGAEAGSHFLVHGACARARGANEKKFAIREALGSAKRPVSSR